MNTHEIYMQKCLNLGRQALANHNSPVGSILVCDDQIIGEGVESVRENEDVTFHAEIEAIRDAVRRGFAGQLSRSVLYTTHEPCIMCSYVIRHHKIAQVVYGLSVDHIGGHTSSFGVLDSEEVPQWDEKPEIIPGILRRECELLHEEFLKTRK